MTTTHRFASFELQADERQLVVDGRPVALGTRAFGVLLALAERPGQLVSKQELLDLVWRGVIVEENNLQVQISTLRKLLGSQVIATVPGFGYRLMLLPIDAPQPRAASQSASAEVPPHTHRADARLQSSALYGRSGDMAALSDCVRKHALVTVVGPAGIGKTKLAEAVAHQLQGEFADGAHVVELAPLGGPELVVDTLARALGHTVGDPHNALELTVRVLTSRHLLLVLDNCEHVLEAVDRVVAALRKGAANVHILATSQEVLRHPDEHVYRLDTLGLPAEATVSSARTAGAVELFVARTQALAPRFALTEENVGGVVEICRRLDGIPLAIELAAARVPLLGIEGVRQRLDQRFHLLTAGARLALRRHQTLRAALEWSYSLLSEAEQAVLEKLGVFAGSFSLECAQQLADNGLGDEWAVLDHLSALVDKSLVTVCDGTSARYRMLETTRAFALERLAASRATSHTMRRHAEVMLDVFERFYRDIFEGTPPANAAEPLRGDLDNLRGALRWACDGGGDHRIAIALFGAAGAATGYVHHMSLGAQAWQWCAMLRPLVDSSTPAPEAARFWLACAQWGALLAPSEAMEAAKRAIVLYRELDDRPGACLSWSFLAYSWSQTGEGGEAKRSMEEALALCDSAWPPWLRGIVDNLAAVVYMRLGALDEARAHILGYLCVARQIGSFLDEWTALSILGDLDIIAGDVEQAAAAASQMLARHHQSPLRNHDGLGMRAYATALMLADRLDEAQAVYCEALPFLKQTYGTAAYALLDAALLLARRGRVDAAARVSAYAQGVFTAEHKTPRPVAQLVCDQLHALLAAARSPDALARLYEEGRRLTDDEACALAFPAESVKPSSHRA